MITMHGWSIPQDASKYRPTIHATQRKNQRRNPSIEWSDVSAVIESAEYQNVTHDRENVFNIYGWAELDSEAHKMRVTVGMAPGSINDIVTVCCRCHDSDRSDCDPAYRND